MRSLLPQIRLPALPFRRRQRRPLASGAHGRRAARPRFALETGRATTADRPRRPADRSRPGIPWRRLFWGTAATATIAAVAAGGVWVVQGDALRVDHVMVIGAQIADPLAISEAADAGGRSLLSLDTAATTARVTALPGVKRTEVRRDWPRGLIVSVTEHQGWGYWQTAGRRVVVDRDGLVLDRSRPPREGAPTIIQVAADAPLEAGSYVDRDTVRLVDQLVTDGSFDRLRVRPERFEFRDQRGLTIRIADGPDAVFGDSQNYEFKVASWGALLDRLDEARSEPSEVDLRFGRQLVLR